jgi:hypothetical protein
VPGWHVYAPPDMTADAARTYAAAILGPFATFARSDMQPKGAFSSQSEATFAGNSRYFADDGLLERPLPFMWRAWTVWRVDHPPDG